ncbi:erythromycin esterase family protein [Spirosoma soli]|uniref:Erythromycin esterase family protein n=1 Tax=Spirosoma soli TaxID=1770529 RepID=A0ABW5LXF7_9BACT
MSQLTKQQYDLKAGWPESASNQASAKDLQNSIHPLVNEQDLDVLLDQIGTSRYVLLGEASHGTAEFYTWRAAISRRLIQEKGFTLIAVEGDWPDAYALNQYIRGDDKPGRVRQVLRRFNRWPTWMWANEEIAQLAEWLREYNDRTGLNTSQVGFYGLDVYSLWESLDEIQQTLTRIDSPLLALAQEVHNCFAPYRRDEQTYALGTLHGRQCDRPVADLLHALQTAPMPELNPDERFALIQNGYVVAEAERYYYTMVRDGNESWNVRDRHMAQTLDRLMDFHGSNAKVIIWAHNTHVGDARYTDMTDENMINLGQLVRERHGDEGVYIVGFGTYEGEVIASHRWGAPYQRLPVPKAQSGSWGDILHSISSQDKLLLLDQLRNTPDLTSRRGQRAIGVVYRPEREWGNYVPTNLPQRYDCFIYLDWTTALHPLGVAETQQGKSEDAPRNEYSVINDA